MFSAREGREDDGFAADRKEKKEEPRGQFNAPSGTGDAS